MCPVALVLLYTAKDDVLIKRMREKSDSESEEMLKSKLEEYHMKSTPMVLFYQEKTKTVSFFFFLESTAFGKKDNLPLYLNVRKTRKTIVVNLDHFIVSISNYSFCVCKYLFNVCNKNRKRRKNPVEHL